MMRLIFSISFFVLLSISLFGKNNTTQREIAKCTNPQLIQSIKDQLHRAELVEKPFPHIVIHDFFPEEFYQNFVNQWPHPHQFAPPCNGRYSILLNQINQHKLPQKETLFWTTFNEYIIETIIKPIIIEKFLPYLHIKFPDASEEEIERMKRHFQPVAKTNSIYLDTGRCSVITHTDKPHYFVQLIIYMPKDNDHEGVGTTFYSGSRHSGKEETCWDTPPDLTYYSKLPYRRNTFIAFLQSPTSWHSLEPSPYPNYLRRTFFSPILTPPEIYIKNYGIDKYRINYLE